MLQWKAGWIGATLCNGQDINQWKAAGYPVVTGVTSHEPPCTLADPDLMEETETYCPWRGLQNSEEGTNANNLDMNNSTEISVPNDVNALTPSPSPGIPMPVSVPATMQALIQRKTPDEAKCGTSFLQESGGAAKNCLTSRNNGARKRGRKLRGV